MNSPKHTGLLSWRNGHIPLRCPIAHGEHAVKAAKGASSEVTLTDCEPVLPGMLGCDGVDLAQFILKEFVRSTVSEYLLWKTVAPDFDLADLLV